ncbi:unnamed protein product [Strongylus vulgaris]|uniref:Uncharacterized protein n=1 Tax=Strongylus vulgaris TaxID=40348 RepID=A0A3P7ILJ6_STRVU|nr:unnamed protein product [Strongylus vulgaris]
MGKDSKTFCRPNLCQRKSRHRGVLQRRFC